MRTKHLKHFRDSENLSPDEPWVHVGRNMLLVNTYKPYLSYFLPHASLPFIIILLLVYGKQVTKVNKLIVRSLQEM